MKYLKRYILYLMMKILRAYGYGITKMGGVLPCYEVYRYVKEDGSFDYERYRAVQVKGNLHKLEGNSIKEETIAFLSEYLFKKKHVFQFGLCHGTRRGKEQEYFQKYLNCKVLGTEISPTAVEFPDTLEWDFHEAKPEWLGAVDFIYSNALDHSYDQEKCLDSWISCLKDDGICIIEHRQGSLHASELDPFGAHLVFMPYLITTWGKGKYSLREIIKSPFPVGKYSYFLIIMKNR